MSEKIALKRLTRSDLTIFQYHLTVQQAGKQKAINLNKDIFVDRLFPALPQTKEGREGVLPLDIHLLGPGHHDALRLQRKIIKGGSYKNWRLNGEIIPTAVTSDRFDPLAPGDFVLFVFSGDIVPRAARLLFVAAAVSEDATLHSLLNEALGKKRMLDMSVGELEHIVNAAGLSDEHPAREFTLEDLIEDAALGGMQGIAKLNRRRSGTAMSRETLQQARQTAETIGRDGEELVNSWLECQVEAGTIREYEWVSNVNAIAPYDFVIVDDMGERVKVDVKSTTGPFERQLHVSIAELYEMANGEERYDLYRIHSLAEGKAGLRIARGMATFAASILDVFAKLPSGVTPDSISMSPEAVFFEEEIGIRLPDDPEE